MRVFLSYMREDQSDMLRLANSLSACGVEVWYDKRDLVAGREWRQSIRDAIGGCDFVIACFSGAYFLRGGATYLIEELTIACKHFGPRDWLIPVILDGAPLPDYTLPDGRCIADFHVLTLNEGWNDGIHQILTGLGLPDEAHQERALLRVMAFSPSQAIRAQALEALAKLEEPEERDMSILTQSFPALWREYQHLVIRQLGRDPVLGRAFLDFLQTALLSDRTEGTIRAAIARTLFGLARAADQDTADAISKTFWDVLRAKSEIDDLVSNLAAQMLPDHKASEFPVEDIALLLVSLTDRWPETHGGFSDRIYDSAPVSVEDDERARGLPARIWRLNRHRSAPLTKALLAVMEERHEFGAAAFLVQDIAAKEALIQLALSENAPFRGLPEHLLTRQQVQDERFLKRFWNAVGGPDVRPPFLAERASTAELEAAAALSHIFDDRRWLLPANSIVTSDDGMTFTSVMKHRRGLDAREAALLSRECQTHQIPAVVSCNGETADVRSIMDLMMLTVRYGDTFEVKISGDDRDDGMRRVVNLILSWYDRDG